MKAGSIIRLGQVVIEERTGKHPYLQFDGESSTENYGKSDAAASVAKGKYDTVYVVKVIAVAKRSAKIED